MLTLEGVLSLFQVSEDEFIKITDHAYVTPQKFVELFSEAGENPTYERLMEIDGGLLGYRGFFDLCKAKGLLK